MERLNTFGPMRRINPRSRMTLILGVAALMMTLFASLISGGSAMDGDDSDVYCEGTVDGRIVCYETVIVTADGSINEPSGPTDLGDDPVDVGDVTDGGGGGVAIDDCSGIWVRDPVAGTVCSDEPVDVPDVTPTPEPASGDDVDLLNEACELADYLAVGCAYAPHPGTKVLCGVGWVGVKKACDDYQEGL